MPDYYQKKALEYVTATVNVDPSPFLTPLANHLQPGATILDIGCGSGRDLRWLKERGFNPTGFERSSTLARMAEIHSGCPVINGDLTTYDFSRHYFDALLLVGALVHLNRSQLPPTLASIIKALSQNGYLFLSLKEGDGTTRNSDGRIFTLWRSDQLENIVTALDLSILETSRQTSKIRPTDIWLGYLLKRQ